MSSAAVTLPRAFVQPGPRGQLQVALPGVSRGRYATGQQEPCVPCAFAGVGRRGVSRDGPGSEPLCMPCWTGREQRRARAEQAELDRRLWEERGELDAAAELEETCPACGERAASPACWLCGWSWLRQAREQFEADQAAAAAAVEAEFAAIAAVSQAEARVADLTAWIERLRQTVHAYDAGFGGRAVELLADLLARLEAEAAGRTSRRGRPSVTPAVGAVLAADADWRSGRRAMPGRERSAWLIGCSDRAVYGAWKQVVALGWAKRTVVGGRNSLERRLETGRANDRAEFDLIPLHTSEVRQVDRAVCVPRALGLFGELLEQALAVLEREQDALDGLRAAAGGWTDWPERVRRTQLRAAVDRTRSEVTDALPALALTANICRSHPVLPARSSSSCPLWGLRYSRPIMIHSTDCGCGRPAFGRSRGGASRSSTTEAANDLDRFGQNGSQRVEHHRTLQTRKACSQPRRAPDWAEWAYELARALSQRWTWLAGQPIPRVAATLGVRLGPYWSADRLVRHVESQQTRPVLSHPDKPLAYLAWLLDVVFAGDEEPPEQSRRHTENRHQAILEQAAAAAAAHEMLRADWDRRAAAEATQVSAGRAAARAAARAARGPAPRPYVSPVAAAATELAARDEQAWTEPVAQPGGGLPSDLETGRDR